MNWYQITVRQRSRRFLVFRTWGGLLAVFFSVASTYQEAREKAEHFISDDGIAVGGEIFEVKFCEE